MNVNEKIRSLESVTGYPTRQDIYRGEESRYIVFTYEDERAALYGDNEELAGTAYLQVTLFTPGNYNYFNDKKKIKKELRKQGFQIESIQSWLEGQNQEIRHTVFSVNITEIERD